MGEWEGPSSSWEKTLSYLLQSKKVDQREHCMKAKCKIHKCKNWQRGQCSKAGGHLVCWRPPQVARSLKSEVRPQLGIWHSDIGTLAAGTLGTACGQVMHTLCFRVKVLNCFYSWLCRYFVKMFASKSIWLNLKYLSAMRVLSLIELTLMATYHKNRNTRPLPKYEIWGKGEAKMENI